MGLEDFFSLLAIFSVPALMALDYILFYDKPSTSPADNAVQSAKSVDDAAHVINMGGVRAHSPPVTGSEGLSLTVNPLMEMDDSMTDDRQHPPVIPKLHLGGVISAQLRQGVPSLSLGGLPPLDENATPRHTNTTP